MTIAATEWRHAGNLKAKIQFLGNLWLFPCSPKTFDFRLYFQQLNVDLLKVCRTLYLNVPSQRTKLLSFLDDGVEETNTKHELPPGHAKNCPNTNHKHYLTNNQSLADVEGMEKKMVGSQELLVLQ